MSNYTTKNPTYFGLPIETVINVEEDGQKIEVIAIPYDNFLTMEDELNQLSEYYISKGEEGYFDG